MSVNRRRALLVLASCCLFVGWQGLPLPGPQRGTPACHGHQPCPPPPPSMATKWIDISQSVGDTADAGWSGAGSIDTVNKKGGYGSLSFSGVQSLNSPAVLADAGRRVSFWVMSTVAPNLTGNGISVAEFGIQANNSGILQVTSNSGSVIATGTKALNANTWYRIAFSYTVTSTTVYSFKLWLNGVLEVSATNGAALSGIGLQLIIPAPLDNSGGSTTFYQHFYVDDGTDLADPAGAGFDIYVTAKLPTGNGNTNTYTTNGTGTGTGTGHAPWINDRPYSATDFLNVTTTGSHQEDYAIQSAAVGDDNIAGQTIIAHTVWLQARLTGSGSTPTLNILDNGVSTTFTPAASFALVTHITDSSTYPSTAPIVGESTTSGSGKSPAIAGAGIAIAYKVPQSSVEWLPQLPPSRRPIVEANIMY